MSPFTILFFVLVAVPLIEIYLLISVGRVIGAGWTILVVVFTAILGAWLLRLQGLNTLQRIQLSTAQGNLPAQELLEGLILLVTGALLLTPGFFTDAVGFALLVPAVRAWAAGHLLKAGIYRATAAAGDDRKSPHRQNKSRTIEGEYREEPTDTPARHSHIEDNKDPR